MLGRCSRASVTASRRFVLMRSPERFGIKAGATTYNRGRAPRPGDKARIPSARLQAELQPVVPIRQSPDRAFDRQRTVFDIAKKSDFPLRPPSAIATACFFLATSKVTKSFAMLSHGPPSVHEARLGLPKQPSFLTARKSWLPVQPREDDV